MSESATPAPEEPAPELESVTFAVVTTALTQLAAGRQVLLVSDDEGFRTGMLLMAAEFATPTVMAYLVRHTSGFLYVPLTVEACVRMGLPPMHARNEDRFKTQFTVSVDAAEGISTGISAHDRAVTARMLADPSSGPESFTRPGHMIPIRAHADGVLTRRGYAEAAVDLCRLAGIQPVGVMSDVVSADRYTEMATREELLAFGRAESLPLVTVDQVAKYRRAKEQAVVRVSDLSVAGVRTGTASGLRLVRYADLADGSRYLVAVADGSRSGPVPLLVHETCWRGQLVGDAACDCVSWLRASMASLVARGAPAVLYRSIDGEHTGDVENARLQVVTRFVEVDLGLQRVESSPTPATIGFGVDWTTEVPWE